jgi:hypothetical protein
MALSPLLPGRVALIAAISLSQHKGQMPVSNHIGLGIPVAIINQGPARGDAEATLTLDAPLGPALTALAGRLPDR